LLLPRALGGCSSNKGSVVDFGPLRFQSGDLVALPEGFRYLVVERSGDRMSDGHPMGSRPDGMACFWDDAGNYVLMRNHEVDGGAAAVPEVAFDPTQGGGVSRLVISARTLARLSSNWVLTGTSRNCAGGPSPWGWLSCEETTEPGHGYVFLCDPGATEARAPERVTSLGRFRHEAVAIDPRTHVAYLTEDTQDGALYRHVPNAFEVPFEGRLQALRVQGAPRRDLGADLSLGDSLEVEWVPIADPEAALESTAAQAERAGAALVRRGEGIWWADDSVYVVATSGGPLEQGQIFRLTPSERGGTLTLVAQAEGEGGFLHPDNLTLAPWGELIVCEDNKGPCHVHRVTAEGEVFPLVQNLLDGGASEFCGACFSPDGKVLFVNIQVPGITLAIVGPFPTG
jgi:secreted PhoX family phosphatase